MSRTQQSTDWVFIPLSRGLFAKVDAADAAVVCQWKWSANQTTKGRFYAQRRERGGANVYLHRYLLGLTTGVLCDHINGDTLDCRRANLRPASHGDNAANNGLRLRGRSGYRGVRLREGRYEAAIRRGGQRIIIGRFDEPVDAARAYDAKAKEMHGEFAVLNFPNPPGKEAA